MKFDNAVLTKDGFVRAKKGKLDIKVIKSKPNMVEQNEMKKSTDIIKNNTITLYHGSKDNNIRPTFGLGKPNNDYGQGFYTTPHKNLAKEWAYSSYTNGDKGYLYTFKDIDISGLNILNLTELSTMHWIAELITHREISLDSNSLINNNIKAILSKYKLNTSSYDIIIGYRADDKYFSYTESFISGSMYIETLEKAIRLGDLGIQVFIKSKEAFNRLNKSSIKIEDVDKKFKQSYNKRDKAARENFNNLSIENRNIKRGKTIYDFI